MKSVVCTLFENHYHFGLAVLINSLYSNDYRGDIYAGFRGELPEWSKNAVDNQSLNWKGAKTLVVKDDLHVHFLPIEVDYQFTNYKPELMLRLFEGPCKDADGIAYFDPDIIVKCKWNFYEMWMSHGVALVHEIMSNDMPSTHPIRKEWEKVIIKCDKKLVRNLTSYINAGFFGVIKQNIEFLNLYIEIMNVGRKHYNFEDTNFQFTSSRTDIFFAKDQDALNIAAMICECPISEMGPEGMDFIQGGFTMSHAVGGAKPWNKNFIKSALKGNPINRIDKIFWSNVYGPIKPYSNLFIKRKKVASAFSGIIGRFYKKY